MECLQRRNIYLGQEERDVQLFTQQETVWVSAHQKQDGWSRIQVRGCMCRSGGRYDSDGQKKRGLWHDKTESNEFGLYLEKNESPLEGFQQLGGETMFCLLKW